MKKYLFLTLLIIIFLAGCSAKVSNEQTMVNVNKNNPPPTSLQMTAVADKSIYSSYEQVILNIELSSDQALNNVLIKAVGITSRLNRNYFDQNQLVSLQKNIVKKVTLSQTLPSCNSCSGLAPGNYTITITADYQGKILATKKINLTIKQ